MEQTNEVGGRKGWWTNDSPGFWSWFRNRQVIKCLWKRQNLKVYESVYDLVHEQASQWIPAMAINIYFFPFWLHLSLDLPFKKTPQQFTYNYIPTIIFRMNCSFSKTSWHQNWASRSMVLLPSWLLVHVALAASLVSFHSEEPFGGSEWIQRWRHNVLLIDILGIDRF